MRKLSKAIVVIWGVASIAFAFYAEFTDDIGLKMLAIGLIVAPFAAIFALVFIMAVVMRIMRIPLRRRLLRQKLNELSTGVANGKKGRQLVKQVAKIAEESQRKGTSVDIEELATVLQPHLSVPTPQTPDEVYWADAHIAGIETGDVFKEWVETYYQGTRTPKPNQAQRDRIAAQFDATNKKKQAFSRTPPLAIVRRPRAQTDVTKGGPNWFGGRPCLGDVPWPLASDSTPMQHMATIDMASLHEFDVPPALPTKGRLAFFIHATGEWPYEGKVVHVTSDAGPTLPPDNLPKIYGEDNFLYGRHDYTPLDAPAAYLHWTVDIMQLPMLHEHDHKSAHEFIANQFPRTGNVNLHTAAFSDTCPQMLRPLLWDTAQRYAKKTTLAERHLESTTARAEKVAEKFTPETVAALDYIKTHTYDLRKFIDEVNNWVRPHDRWDVMTAADQTSFDAFVERATQNNDHPLGLHLYYPYETVKANIGTYAEERDATFRTIARGPENLYRHLPYPVKDEIDQTHRIPGRSYWHQMFGVGSNVQVAAEEHPYDHLLLQLHSDHMMQGAWSGSGIAQFWISPDALQSHRWDQVDVTFEND